MEFDMKSITTALYFFSFILAFGQNESQSEASVFRSDNQVIYLGVLNDITINVPGNGFTVQCPLCDTIYKGELSNRFFIKPGYGKFTELIITDSATSELLSTQRINNINLPDPVLFYGHAKSGGKCSRLAKQIAAIYPPEMKIDLDSKIVNWTIQIEEHSFKGVGDQLTDELLVLVASLLPQVVKLEVVRA